MTTVTTIQIFLRINPPAIALGGELWGANDERKSAEREGRGGGGGEGRWEGKVCGEAMGNVMVAKKDFQP